MARIGIHLSISKGLSYVPREAKRLGCQSLQIFSQNPRAWQSPPLKKKEIEGFLLGINEYQLGPVLVHGNYLVNLASPDDSIYLRSKLVLKEDLIRSRILGAEYLILHPGNHRGGGVEYGIERIIKALEEVKEEPVKILLENTAGAGTEIGSNFQELGIIIGETSSCHGVCLDTCHAFVAGYELRTEVGWQAMMEEFYGETGFESPAIIHLNDARTSLGSKKDHHQHIGEGKIGRKGFQNMLRCRELREVPLILETPQRNRGDKEKNISQILDLLNSQGEQNEDP